MRPTWRLAVNSLAGKPGRTAMLVLAVAIASALSTAISSAIAAAGAAVEHKAGGMVGLVDLTLVHRYGEPLPQGLLDAVRRWPEARTVAPRLRVGVSLQAPGTQRRSVVQLRGIDPQADALLHPVTFRAGRGAESDREIALGAGLAEYLGLGVGDGVEVLTAEGTPPLRLTIVGVFERPELAVLQKPAAAVTLAVAQGLAQAPGRVDLIDLGLDRLRSASEVERLRGPELPATVRFQSSASVSTKVNRGVRAARLLVALITGLVFTSAGFIVLTTLTVSVAQRTRELAVLRCVGASRWQVAGSQLVAGLVTCLAGAALGAPLGLLTAWRLHEHYRDALGVPFSPDPWGVLLATSAAAAAGLLGSAYPAWRAASVGPLEAMTGQARPPSARGPWLCAALGLAMAVAPFLWLYGAPSLESALVGYLALGVPLSLLGYFLLCIPIALLIAHAASGLIARLFVLPAPLLRQSLTATPYRHGMTGGALMVGVALLVTIWTDGRSIHTGWFTRIQMPDAFLHSFFSLQPAQIERVRSAPAVASLCPTKTFAVKVVDSALGLAGMTDGHTQFVSSDFESFMGMTQLEWVQGNAATALPRLRQGRALLVSREYLVSRGVGVGSRLTLETLEGPVEFEVVGVVYSPGLDVAVHWFDLQPYYAERSISSVFGTREDAKKYFGVDTANLLLLNLRDDVKDDEALKQLRERAPGTVVGSNRAIREEVASVVSDSMRVASTIALVSLVIGCLGVGNLVIAHVSARRFELGVLRAAGASGALLGRLVAAEALASAITGSLAGAALGYQLSVAAAILRNRLFGLGYTPEPALDVAALGAVAVSLAALLAALPPAIRVSRSPVTALLAAGRHG